MALPAEQFPTDSSDDEQGRAGPFFDPHQLLVDCVREVATDHARWPDYDFALNSRKLVGSMNVEATRASRFRAVTHALLETAPDAVATNYPDKPLFKILSQSEQFLRGHVKIRGEEIPRGTLLGLNNFLDYLRIDLQEINDPVAQVLDQVELQYGTQLSPVDMDILEHDVLLATKQKAVLEITSQFIAGFKAAATAETNVRPLVT